MEMTLKLWLPDQTAADSGLFPRQDTLLEKHMLQGRKCRVSIDEL